MTKIDVEKLVGADRVHGRLYHDPDVFEQELERIWYGNWVYVAHESEVPRPGDFCRKRVGLQEVVLNRDMDGRVHLFYNRCPHRGNQLCLESDGNSSRFTCAYHGWTFASNGDVAGIPLQDGYGENFDQVRARTAMSQVANVATYRGFIFCSVNAPAQPFEEYIAPVRAAIDQLCDLSPEGEVVLSAGWLRHRTRCNWKVITENEVDGYHVRFVHRSLFTATSTRQSETKPDATVVLGNGHNALSFSETYRHSGHEFQWFGGIDRKRLPGYVAAMNERYGEEVATQRFVDGPPHVMVFPNLFIAQMNILVIQPLSPSESTQDTTPVLLKGAPEINQRMLRRSEAAMGPAGMFIADDGEVGERNQIGLSSAMYPEWLELSRGLERERVEGDRVVSDETDEGTQRAIWARYTALMANS